MSHLSYTKAINPPYISALSLDKQERTALVNQRMQHNVCHHKQILLTLVLGLTQLGIVCCLVP